MAVGVSAGINHISLNTSEITLATPLDPAITNGNNSQWKPDVGLGAWLYSSDYYVGLSVQQILPENLYFSTSNTVVDVSDQYTAYTGRQNIIFQYQHNASDNRRIDPASSNLIDCYILTRSYDESYRNYITDYTNTLTMPSMIDSVTLNNTYGQLLNLKMISDELILNSGIYKPLFGSKAASALQAIFQIVKNPASKISDNELKSKLIEQVNNYFALENWDFGQTFYFSELSAYLHTNLGSYLSSVILIPTSTESSFGDLYEIRSQPNEILINAATVDNVSVVSGVYVGINQSGVSTILTSQI